MEYRQWHEEDKVTFHNESTVYFSECSRNGTLGLEKLLKLTSDLAVKDFALRGMSAKTLLENHYAILVSSVAFRFHQLPVEKQNITFSTWEEKSQPLQFLRQYEINDTDSGKPLISGYSTWLLVDPEARRILPIKKFTMRPEVNYQKGHDCMEPGKISIPENTELWDTRKIRRSEIDSNGHTNNSRYGAFIEDALPEALAEKQFTDFRLNYCKEAVLGDTLKIFGAVDEEGKKLTVLGKKENGETSFEAELYWKD